MAPNLTGPVTGLFLSQAEVIPPEKTLNVIEPVKSQKPKDQYEFQIVWRNVLAFVYIHVGALYGVYLLLTAAQYKTMFFSYFVIFLGGMGTTAGAHRLWAHKCYKATWPLRVILVIFQTIAFQNHVFEWVRDHRVHHKFTDTDADPHNSKRGFFFSHIGWLMVKKHNDVVVKGKTVDMSDLEQDWVVMTQKKIYPVFVILCSFVLPTVIPIYYWNETPWVSFYVAGILRYALSLHGTWLVNSAAHLYGTRPYDKTISPRENLSVSLLAFGEGWHNYHHAFPWDYKTSEFCGYRTNVTTGFIDFFAKIGWAYDLKTATLDMVKRRVVRVGDGSHESISSNDSGSKTVPEFVNRHEGEVWGWDDKDMKEEDKKMVEITHKKHE